MRCTRCKTRKATWKLYPDPPVIAMICTPCAQELITLMVQEKIGRCDCVPLSAELKTSGISSG